ncbi:hypothetical protein PR202_gb06919 [Eleusine coracana subsp. coracana]|uniref:F-box domain-containing protein n=1 Tax=Eleusine coracana subsp. coracana TaxID=191504 RepID=A0AAV5EAV3_ELECO|nr:hypothetical protein PR202_gb06919 [Eleusine coracana subsp. coracana]
MEIARPPPPPPTAAAVAVAAAMFSVLGNDDLLREILLRLGLPTSLLRAALVCKRWYRHASDPDFLRRFRDRNPPRILGVYLNALGGGCPRFFPIRPLPELAATAHRPGSFFDAVAGSTAFIVDSGGGRLLVTAIYDGHGYYESSHLLCSPLSSAGNAVVVPPPPRRPPVELPGIGPEHLTLCTSLPDGRSWLCVLMGFRDQQTTVWLYELQEMCWVARASAAAQLPESPTFCMAELFDDSKFYSLITGNKILVCDFPSSTISAMELPNGVESDDDYHSIMLSRRDGSGIYLIHVKESLLRVFHNDDAGNWFLIRAVGDNAKFVFLDMFGTIVFLDATSKQAEKVYEVAPDDVVTTVHPLMLIWPPVFPQLKEGYHQQD